jgi:hypothetical protein
VDARGDIREVLTSRRARVTPAQVGLPTYGDHRRVPGLRREEVALLAGVSVDYYTRMERGKICAYTAEAGSTSAQNLDVLASWAATTADVAG